MREPRSNPTGGGGEESLAAGTRPPGVAEAEAARYVRGLFEAIAPRYDRANHLLSLSIDRLWRRHVARTLAGMLPPDARILDVCCGTGDLALALAARGPGWRVCGADFAPAMLRRARRKSGCGAPAWVAADALQLPWAAESADAVTTAFGFRNLANYRAALGEFLRVLRPGGVVAILEFSEPATPLLGPLYAWYFHRVLPRLGAWISGHRASYAYLPASVARFPRPEELARWMRECGYDQVRYRLLTAGIAVLHTARKP